MIGIGIGITSPAVLRGGASGEAPPLSLLLDDLSVAATGAYATWKLSNAYAGPCLRVRRSSDNAEQDIGFASGNLDTVALLAFAGASNGFVSKWYDQSGNANHFLQSTASAQPLIVDSGALIVDIHGLPSPLFNGTSSYLSGPTQGQLFTSATGFSTFGLSRPLAGGTSTTQPFTGPQILSESSGWTYNGYGHPSAFTGGYWSGSYAGVTIPVTFPSTHVSCVAYSSASGVKAWLDGGTGAAVAATAFAQHTTVAMRLGASQSGYFDGNICSVLAFGATVGLTDVNRIGADWAAKAGLVWSPAT